MKEQNHLHLDVVRESPRSGIWPFRGAIYIVSRPVETAGGTVVPNREVILDGWFRNSEAALRAARKLLRAQNNG